MPSLIDVDLLDTILTGIENRMVVRGVPNMFDNWYLVNPIIQRFVTERTGQGYLVDRWRSSSDSIQQKLEVGKGLRITSTSTSEIGDWHQVVDDSYITPDLYGREITGSFLIDEGNAGLSQVQIDFKSEFNGGNTLDSKSVVITNPGVTSVTCTVPAGTKGIWAGIHLRDGNILVRAGKLELGKRLTLAHKRSGNWLLNDPAPAHDAELRKCERYLRGIGFREANAYRNIAPLFWVIYATPIVPVMQSAAAPLPDDEQKYRIYTVRSYGSGKVQDLSATGATLIYNPPTPDFFEVRIDFPSDTTLDPLQYILCTLDNSGSAGRYGPILISCEP